jgi:hypothetical protein
MTPRRAFAIVALPLCLLLATSAPKAAPPPVPKNLQDIQDIAALLPNDKEKALKLAAALGAKLETVEIIMGGFTLRKKHGFGIGPATDNIKPDGIERFLNGGVMNAVLLTKQTAEFQEMGHRIAAIAEAARHFRSKDFGRGKKKKEDWQRFAEKMREGGFQLAEAARTGKPKEFDAARALIVQQCNGCHVIFRE